MKKTFFAAASAAFALSSAYAECPLKSTVTTTILKDKSRERGSTWGSRSYVTDYSPETREVQLTEKQKEFLQTEKGYTIITVTAPTAPYFLADERADRATFRLVSSESQTKFGAPTEKTDYSLVFSPANRVIWRGREARQGTPASAQIHVDNQKILSDVKEIDAYMARTNNPSELNALQMRKQSVQSAYRRELDTVIPAVSSLDLALAALPKCGDK